MTRYVKIKKDALIDKDEIQMIRIVARTIEVNLYRSGVSVFFFFSVAEAQEEFDRIVEQLERMEEEYDIL